MHTLEDWWSCLLHSPFSLSSNGVGVEYEIVLLFEKWNLFSLQQKNLEKCFYFGIRIRVNAFLVSLFLNYFGLRNILKILYSVWMPMRGDGRRAEGEEGGKRRSPWVWCHLGGFGYHFHVTQESFKWTSLSPLAPCPSLSFFLFFVWS